MYEEFLRDPAAVGPEWRRLFESGVVGEVDGGSAGQRGSGAARQVTPVSDAHSATQRSSSLAPASTSAPRPRSPAASPITGPAAKLVANMTESLTVPTATTFRELSVAVLEGPRSAPKAAPQAARTREKKGSLTPPDAPPTGHG